MAKVHGYLRDEATYGEKETLKFLEQKLPSDVNIFVEAKIIKDRGVSHADFVVLTNYGFIVLEVKDWVNIVRISPSTVEFLDRQNNRHHTSPPVDIAREMAFKLLDVVNKRINKRFEIGYGAAAVMYNAQAIMIGNMRTAWGENSVISQTDLKNPDLLAKRLRNTLEAHHIHILTKEQIQDVTIAIFPEYEYQTAPKKPIMLDPVQQQLVTAKPAEPREKKAKPVEQTPSLFPDAIKPEPEKAPESIEQVEALFKRTSVRLVRGVAGSGKTIVLIQRAKYLADRHPDRKVLVLSFNKKLAGKLKSNFTGIHNITCTSFHALCYDLIGDKELKMDSPEGWTKNNAGAYPRLTGIPTEYLTDEITWIKDNSLSTLEDYLAAERKGRGNTIRLTRQQRESAYEMVLDYNTDLASRNMVDFADLADILLSKIRNGEVTPPDYDIVLIDEAQDFAPSWIKVVTRIIKDEKSIIFLVDDPTQSIYKRYTWKEKGIPVVGATVRLSQPYRNSLQIYHTANALLNSDTNLKGLIDEDQNESNVSEVDTTILRTGPRPLLFKAKGIDQEADFIKRTIDDLLKRHNQTLTSIAILCPHKKQIDRLRQHIKMPGLIIDTFHSYKGLESETVILSGIHECFSENQLEEKQLEEKKLFYMAITRARKFLFLTSIKGVPQQLNPIRDTIDVIGSDL